MVTVQSSVSHINFESVSSKFEFIKSGTAIRLRVDKEVVYTFNPKELKEVAEHLLGMVGEVEWYFIVMVVLNVEY